MRLLAALTVLACLAIAVQAQHSGGMMPGVMPSVNMTDPCYAAPWETNCTTFRRMHTEWTSDMTSLCNAMPYMVGCTFWRECKPVLARQKQIDLNGVPTNVSAAFGTYCGMVSLVGDVCVEMPRMKGCEAYNALCMANSTVATCQQPGPIPDVLWTWDTKAAVDQMCAERPRPVCVTCSSPGSMNMTACADPTTTLKVLCDETPFAPQCFNITRMCSNVDVKTNLTSTCADPYPGVAPCATNGAGTVAAGALTAVLMLAAVAFQFIM